MGRLLQTGHGRSLVVHVFSGRGIGFNITQCLGMDSNARYATHDTYTVTRIHSIITINNAAA